MLIESPRSSNGPLRTYRHTANEQGGRTCGPRQVANPSLPVQYLIVTSRTANSSDIRGQAHCLRHHRSTAQA